ncbi:MAG: MFS transporter [Cyanobacteria bacterium]|nr:MFS transporter [Cyanobacteriota bacterium]
MGSTLILAIITGLSVANLYYVQSLLPLIASQLDLHAGEVFLIPTAIQIGLALALLLLLPIGDSRERRRMLILSALGMGVACAAIGLLPSFSLLLLAFFLLGLTALVPYLLPAYVSALVPDAFRGRTLGLILSGQFTGMLLSRSVSGLVGQYLGWRTIFLSSAVVMVGVACWIRSQLPREQNVKPIAYLALQASQLGLLRRYSGLRQACLSQGLQFGTFMALWCGLALHLAEPPWRLNSAWIGAFGLVGIVSIVAAPHIGRLVDQFGASRLVVAATLVSLLGVTLLLCFPHSLLAIAGGLILLDLGVQGSYVANQTRVFSLDPAARSRLGCLLFFSAYLGAAIASSLVAVFWSHWHWSGLTLFGAILVLLALLSQFGGPRCRPAASSS